MAASTFLVTLGTIFWLLLPVFALIGLGFASGKARYLEEPAARQLTQFGIKVAMPMLLFRAGAQMKAIDWSLLQLPIVLITTAAIVWSTATLATWLVLRRPAADAPSIAIASCFGNGVMLGIPLLVTVLGPDVATPLAILIANETIVLWIIGTLHIGIVGVASKNGQRSMLAGLGAMILDLGRNTIVMSMLAGILWRLTGLTIPEPIDRIMALIAQAAIPVTLFALGLSLAEYRLGGQVPTLLTIGTLKLVAYPVIAYALAAHALELDGRLVALAVIFASMPVGANAFMFAAKFERAVNSVSAALAITTAIALMTVTIVIALLGALGHVPLPKG
jgi:hypothetical protein